MIFSYFEKIEKSIKTDLFTLTINKNSDTLFKNYNINFDKLSKRTDKLLVDEIAYLQQQLDKTENNRNHFIDTIKIEVVILS